MRGIGRVFQFALHALLMLIAVIAYPQNARSQAASTSPTLDATLRFIAEKLGEEGKIAYTVVVTDAAHPDDNWTNRFLVELSNPHYDLSGCSISFHWHAEVNGKAFDDNDYSIAFRSVAGIDVMSQDVNQHQLDSRNGHDSYQSKTSPSLFALVVRRPQQLQNTFLFTQQDMADRVARAMIHATELCGGANEPF